MPHLTVEYTDNLASIGSVAALRTLNGVLLASGHFEEADIKSRAVPLAVFASGTAETPRGFIHATLGLLDGRSGEVKQALSHALLHALETLHQAQGMEVQISVNVVDLPRSSYAKSRHTL